VPNPVVHFEIIGRDGSALQRFYAETFGWTVNADNPMNYGMVDASGQGISGGIGAGPASLATFYIEVDDPARYLDNVKAAGGKVVMDVTEIPGYVTIAQFEDPAGNVIGLLKASS
jgi:uncharacterized protein